MEEGLGIPCQARVENTFYRDKAVIGGRLRARTQAGQETEATVACHVLNRKQAVEWSWSKNVTR